MNKIHSQRADFSNPTLVLLSRWAQCHEAKVPGFDVAQPPSRKVGAVRRRSRLANSYTLSLARAGLSGEQEASPRDTLAPAHWADRGRSRSDRLG